MSAYLLDWFSLLARWAHIVTGIAWIGSSFYFVWLDNHLLPPERPDGEPGVAGELWAVHGGGFYRARKYAVAPQFLPRTLHWFYWEAYSTWITGMLLLSALYFAQADAYLVDPSVLALSRPAAIGVALAFITGSWLLYDGACRSPLGRRPKALAATVTLLVAVLAFGLCHAFGGRGAFIVYGACLGTIMVANVFFVIIPGQRELVQAKQQGRDPDPQPGLRGKQRSVHNTYFTLPVLFVMISNHYAMTWGGAGNWMVLLALSFAGASLRAWFVIRHKAEWRERSTASLPLVASLVTLALVAAVLRPVSQLQADMVVPDAAQVQAIVVERCTPCHTHQPTVAGFNAPPNGIVLESVEQMRAHLPEVRKQLALHAMPLGNLTHMTDVERAQLLLWAGAGGAT